MSTNLRSLILASMLFVPGVALFGCASEETVTPPAVEQVPADAPVNEPPSTDEQ